MRIELEQRAHCQQLAAGFSILIRVQKGIQHHHNASYGDQFVVSTRNTSRIPQQRKEVKFWHSV
jgi:hypothetical protein